MRYKLGTKQETHVKMLSSAGELFREHGINGVGVDGISKAAGVTSGAFYKHFTSKSDAFEKVLDNGLSEVVDSINLFRETHGDHWWQTFAEFYMGELRTCELSRGCSMQSLSAEVMRADAKAKSVFQRQIKQIVNATDEDFDTAISNLSMLVGDVTLARAVGDEALSDRIAKSVSSFFEEP